VVRRGLHYRTFTLDLLSCEGHFCGAHGRLDATHAGALRASAIRLVLVDGTPDAKAFTMLTQLESSAALRDLMETHLLSSSAAAAADGELSVRLFTYTAPKYAKNSAYKA